jgi:aminopeptidase N
VLAKIAAFEFRYQLRNPVFWVTAALFFLFCFGLMAVEQMRLPGNSAVHRNAPLAILQAHGMFSMYFMFVTTAFVANVIVRDDDTGFGPIVRSTRITKLDYLLGRFAGATMVAALAFLAVPLGLLIGSLMPWVDAETVGPNRLSTYLFAYFVLGLPNILITSAAFFALATATRSMMATYLGVVAFLVIYVVSIGLARGRPEIASIVAHIEPFGIRAVANASRYWTVAERNSQLPELWGALVVNRLLWIGLCLALLALAYRAYRFTDRAGSRKRSKKEKLAALAAVDEARPSPQPLPSGRFDASTARAQLWERIRFEIKLVVRSPAFIVLIELGLGGSIPLLWVGSELFGTPTVPVTSSMISILESYFTLIPLIIAIYYAGEFVWRDRERRMNEIVDATPIPNWAYVVPKTAAVATVLVSTLVASAAAAIAVQLVKGHNDLELGKYLLWYILPLGVDVTLIAVLAVVVQALSPSKYVGWGIMVLYVVLESVASAAGIEHNLLLYGHGPAVQYSDMNGAGHFWQGAWWFRLYWAAIALLLLVVTHLLWRRGPDPRLKPRLKRLPSRLRGGAGWVAAGAAATAMLTGGWIFYNTNVLNDFASRDENDRYLAAFESKYLPYEALPHPDVSHVQLSVALYPEERRAETSGSFRITNRTNRPISELHLRNADRELELVSIAVPGARLATDDTAFGYRIYRLQAPMRPGESREIRFETRRQDRGFRNSGGQTSLVGNGTFLNAMELTPLVGMNRAGLLQERAKRRRYDLPPELRPAKLEQIAATARSELGLGWATADITLSTSADQTPIAPGKKVSDTVRDGRRTARFVSDAPIRPMFSIQSARYAEKHLRHAGVDLAVYHHPGHTWNVDRMLKALAVSLDYYQGAFGPYQFDQARIIEFPGYAQFAQAFANTIPYSEIIGFVMDASDPNEIDYVTYVTAHELAHQYWAHQLAAADMQGATILSETLAQYSALMVMKKMHGEDKIRRFLKFELDNYLGSRGQEGVEELPLVRVENQQYIHYRKGSLAMYLLQQRIGEDAVNRALRGLLQTYKFKGAPYPRSLDLLKALRAQAAAPEDQALITDLFERIALYDLRTEKAETKQRPDGKWQVTLTIEASKFYADGAGAETETKLDERIEIGLFTAEPGRGAFDRRNVIRIERLPIRSGRQTVTFVVAKKPSHAGIDPYNFYIDRKSDDNVAAAGVA